MIMSDKGKSHLLRTSHHHLESLYVHVHLPHYTYFWRDSYIILLILCCNNATKVCLPLDSPIGSTILAHNSDASLYISIIIFVNTDNKYIK